MNGPRQGTTLRQRAGHGITWTTIDALATRLVTTAVFVVLARLLEPAAFGLVALALVFIALSRLVVDQGFGTAIVQRADLTKAHLDTAFWMSLAVGVVLATALYVGAGPLATLLGAPDLAPVLRALSAVVVVAAPSSTATAVMSRNFDYRRLALRRLVGTLAGGAAGVAVALAGGEVWSIVAQALVQTVVSTTTLWVLSPYRPGLQVSRQHLRELFSFGNKVTGMTFVTFVSRRSDDLLIGAALGAATLGLYSVANRLLRIMNEVLSVTVETVSLSAFSRLQADQPRLRAAYLTMIRSSIAISAPAYLTVAVLAPDVVHVLFGTRWAASGPVMQALAVAGLGYALGTASQQVLLAVGRARAAFLLSGTHAVVNVAGFVVAVQFGMVAVAVAVAVRAFLLLPLSIEAIRASLGFSWGEWLRPVSAPVASALLSAAGVLLLREATVDVVDAWVRVVAGALVAGLLYAGAFRILSRSQFTELVRHVRSTLPGRRRGDGAGVAADTRAADTRAADTQSADSREHLS